MNKNMKIGDMRGAMKMIEEWTNTPKYNKWNKEATFVRKSVGGRKYHPNAKRTYAYLHTPNGKEKAQNRKCMLFFHGGGAVAGRPEGFLNIMNRYAAQADVNIINTKYRLAPEAKVPSGINDGYAAFMDVRQNPKRFGCDPNKIGFFGESGGGYITAGVGLQLAERNQGHLARFQI